MTDENTPDARYAPDDWSAESGRTGAVPEGERTPAAQDTIGKRLRDDMDGATLVGGILALAVAGYLLLAEHDVASLWVLPPLIIGGGVIMLILAVLPRRG